ncbi:hypothetical protein WJX81_003754 [Elliptochloris bilobata]|uniref:Pep3/Vps18 beta-propeller domain-containing protein n=1 Tax=Elliptochloris bilobata TaxID=381761 RepID=A0AAW1RE12_9CHLO
MSLLDEWDSSGAVYGEPGVSADLLEDADTETASPRSTQQTIFALETVERHVSRGRGQVTSAAAAADCVVISTARAFLLRYDFSQGNTPVLEVQLSSAAEARATGVWLDPSGMHTLVAVVAGNTLGATAEAHYVHARWKRSRPIGKMKGVSLTAVGWNAAQVTEASTGEVVLGDDAGGLHSFSADERDKRERSAAPLYAFEGRTRTPITGLQQHALAGGRTLVLAATATRLYTFAGGPTLEALFSAYPESGDLTNFRETPGEGGVGALCAWAPPGAERSQRVAWLGVSGALHARLAPPRQQVPPYELDYLEEAALLPLPMSPGVELPVSLALTQYHLLLLVCGRVQAVNRVSGKVVQEIVLGSAVSGAPVLGLTADEAAGTIYLFTGEGLHEVAVRDEERDMWSVHLAQGEYTAANRYARTQAQRDQVTVGEAEARFAAGEHDTAARLWGRTVGAGPSFEETALRFVDAGATGALQAFLLARLDALGPDDRAQATMVATWLVELLLDQINRALLEDTAEAHTAVDDFTARLRAFLKERVNTLDVGATVHLLASYGRLDDLMHYATFRQDNEAVLEYLLQRGEAGRALAVLRRPGVSPELLYKFAPALVAAAPGPTVDAWLAAQPPLEPRRLLPALLRLGEAGAPKQARTDALRYVRFCVGRLGSTDAAVHNLAVALYAAAEDEGALLEYLAAARDPLGAPLYEPQFALRVARQGGHLKACVQLFCELNLYEDAVMLALSFDRSLATAVAARPEDDEALQRKLWLAIARYLIKAAAAAPDADAGAGVAAVNEVLREAGGKVRIEDVLPLFPDFVTIDAFKAAICASLEDYNSQIERLKGDMADATRIADALRRDMVALEQRTATLDMSEPCARCGAPVGAPPPPAAGPSGGAVPQLYLFPTGNAFHGACLAAEVIDMSPPDMSARIAGIMKRLSQVAAGEDGVPASGDAAAAKVTDLVAEFEAAVATEDPYSGEIVVRNIGRPFITAGEAAEVASWQL